MGEAIRRFSGSPVRRFSGSPFCRFAVLPVGETIRRFNVRRFRV
jgi:hypothetical protein